MISKRIHSAVDNKNKRRRHVNCYISWFFFLSFYYHYFYFKNYPLLSSAHASRIIDTTGCKSTTGSIVRIRKRDLCFVSATSYEKGRGKVKSLSLSPNLSYSQHKNKNRSAFSLLSLYSGGEKLNHYSKRRTRDFNSFVLKSQQKNHNEQDRLMKDENNESIQQSNNSFASILDLDLDSDSDSALNGVDNLTFQNLYSSSLPPWLLDRLETLQFTTPTKVQAQSLPSLLEGKDVLIQSQTGSGKTLAYLLPLLAKIDPKKSYTQAIIVVPTRELGMQVASVAKQLASGYYYEEAAHRPNVTGKPNLDETPSVLQQQNNDQKNNSILIKSMGMGEKKKKRILIMSLLEGSANRRQKLWAKAEPPHIIIGNPSSLASLMGSTALFGTEEATGRKDLKNGIRKRSSNNSNNISNRDEQKQRYRHVQTLVIDEVDAIQGNSKMRSSIHDVVTNALTTQIMITKEVVRNADCETKQADSNSSNDDEKHNKEIDDLNGTNIQNQHQDMKIKTIRYKPRQTILCSATIPQHHHFLRHCYQSQWTLEKPIHVHINNNLDQPRLPPTLEHLLLVCPEPKDRIKALLSYMKQIIQSTPTSSLEGNSRSITEDEGRRTLTENRKIANNDKQMKDDDLFNSLSPFVPNLSSIIIFAKNELEARVITTELQAWKIRQLKSKFDESDMIESNQEGGNNSNSKYSIEIGMLLEGQNINSRRAEIDTFKQIAFDQNVKNNNNNSTSTSYSEEVALENPSKHTFNILVTTDFACRGLDLPSCSHVIQIGLPDATTSSSSYSSTITQSNTLEYSASTSKRGNSQSKESYMDIYVHRAGRTGRMGQFGVAKGKVVTIVTAGEQPFVKRLCNALNIKMKTRHMRKK